MCLLYNTFSVFVQSRQLLAVYMYVKNCKTSITWISLVAQREKKGEMF